MKLKYCAVLKNKDKIIKWFSSDRQAIARFKKLAIDQYSEVSDISKQINKKWYRIPF